MIAISDNLEDFMSKQNGPAIQRPMPMNAPEMRPPQHSMGPPVPPGPGRIAPGPQMAPPGPPGPGSIDLPPPPPKMESNQKRSLGGLFK